MTKLLHRADAYITSFKAHVTVVGEQHLILDRTAFYARSGGQAGDTGSIAGVAVRDTYYLPDGSVAHEVPLDRQLPVVGASVVGAIDWDRRYRLMRLHSAQHLLYLAMGALYKLDQDRGGDISPERCRVDVAHERLSGPELELGEIRDWVAAAIAANLEIVRRTDPAVPGRWIWSIDGLPEIGCGGTHVRSTAEVGSIDIHLTRKGSKVARLTAGLDVQMARQ